MIRDDTRKWTPIQEGRFYLRILRESGETPEQLHERLFPGRPRGVVGAEVAAMREKIALAEAEAEGVRGEA